MVRAPASSGAALDDGCNVADGPHTRVGPIV